MVHVDEVLRSSIWTHSAEVSAMYEARAGKTNDEIGTWLVG